MTRKNHDGEVWVYAESDHGSLAEVSIELLSKGRQLADALNVPLGALLVGDGVAPLGRELIAFGADSVHLVENARLARYQASPYAKIVAALVQELSPQIVLYGASGVGRDLAPRIASTLRAGLTADCTDLDIGDYVDPVSKEEYKNLLLQIRPAFGGNIIAWIVNPERWPQMATVREGVMRMPEPDSSRQGSIIPHEVRLTDEDFPLDIIDEFRAEKKINLKAARIIVAGGAGVGSKDNFKLIYDLANALGGAVGSSRAAVDNGYIPKDHQVGQTGTTVRPALYIACGISGAVQHRAGMQEASKIIAINKDPHAPIFSVAHYRILGDLNTVIPMFVQAVKERAEQ